jgi:hypothetical protein
MRINQESLLKIAQDTVSKRVRNDPGIVSAYLCGALLEDNYLLGGTADIDLVFIHISDIPTAREIVRLTDEVHLDIAHHLQKDYEQPREVRAHPWMGPTIFICKPLYDVGHFFDFIQASVRGQFYRPDYVLKRARSQAEHARQIWFSLHDENLKAGLVEIENYLRAVGHAANAVALLSGLPLTERRLLLVFPERAEAIGHPGLYAGLLGLLGSPMVDREVLQSWLVPWEQAILALPQPVARPRLHPDRKMYYLKAFEAMLGQEDPQVLLWPLLNTWAEALKHLPVGAPQVEAGLSAYKRLGLLGEGFTGRVAALDAYLDLVEETLEDWAEKVGA